MPFLIIKGNCFFNTSISNKELQSIDKAASKKDIISIWDKMCDWFFSTHKVQAKELLFTLMGENVSSNDRLKSFLNLRELCSDPYKKMFSIETKKYLDMDSLDSESEMPSSLMIGISNGDYTCKISLPITDIKDKDKEKLPQYIEKTFVKEGNIDFKNLLKKDIYRSFYKIKTSNETYHFRIDDGKTNKQEIVKSLLLGLNPHQAKWLNILASQTLGTGTIAFIFNELNVQGFQSYGQEFEILYNIDFISEEVILIKYSYKNDVPPAMLSTTRKDNVYDHIACSSSFLITHDDLICLEMKFTGYND